MENVSHSRQPNMLSKKSCNGSSNNGFGAAKTMYDDVFGGPPRFGTPTLSPRVEDYSEIFGGFHASRASSIPVLDLPLADATEVFFDVRSSGFDYGEVFGGCNGHDFAASYEEVLMMEKANGRGDDSESDEAWMPADPQFLPEESDHSVKNQCSSNGDSHESIDGSMEFNISYHKARQSSNEDLSNGITHVTKLLAVPGYTLEVDKTTSLPKSDDHYSPLHASDNGHLNIDYDGEMMGERHLKKTMSYPANGTADSGPLFVNDVQSHRGFVRNDSLPNEMFVTISDVSLRTQPSHLPPPSRPPPVLVVKKRDSSKSTPNCESVTSGGTASDSSPPYFDVEVDASSSAAASAAAIEDAMEKALAKLKSAKELMERKKDGFQTHEKLGSNNERKNKEGKANRLADGPGTFKDERMQVTSERKENEEEFSALGSRQDVSKATQLIPDSLEGKKLLNAAKRSPEEKPGRVLPSQGSDKIDGVGEWKQATQFFELVKRNKCTKIFDLESDENVLAPDTNIYDQMKREKEAAMGALEHHDESDMKAKTVRVDHEMEAYGKKSKVSKEVHEQVKNNGKAEAAKVAYEQTGLEKMVLAGQDVFKSEKNEKKQTRADDSKKHENMVEIQRTDSSSAVKQMMKHKEKEPETKVVNRGVEIEKRFTDEKEDIEKRHRGIVEWEEKEEKHTASLEQAENVRRLKETLEGKEKEKRMKEAREREDNEKKKEESYQKEENEKRLRDLEQEESERRVKEALKKEENEQRLRETLEKEENEKRQREALEREENERRQREALEREENERRQREALEREENEGRVKEALEKEENERRQREAREREDNEKRRQREALEKKENEGRVKEALEKKENEGRQREAREREDNEKRQIEALKQKEKGKKKEDVEREKIDKRRNEAFEKEEIEKEIGKRLEGACQQEESGKTREDHVLLNQGCQMPDDKHLGTTQLYSEHEQNSETLEETEVALEKIEKVPTELRSSEKDAEVDTVNVHIDEKIKGVSMFHANLEHEKSQFLMEDATKSNGAAQSVKGAGEAEHGLGPQNFEINNKGASRMDSDIGNQWTKFALERGKSGKIVQQVVNQEDKRDNFTSNRVVKESVEIGRKVETAQAVRVEGKGTTQRTADRKVKNLNETLPSEEKEADRMKTEQDLEKERLHKIEEEREREREREKDRMAVDRSALEARERAYAESRERAERAAVERATAEARQRAMTEARERLERACAEARERSLSDKTSAEARLRAERAAVERALAEARERAFGKAMAERAASEAKECMERSVSDKFSTSSRISCLKSSLSSSDLHGFEGESAQRCKARLERHRRTAERAAKALAEKNMRDLLAQREQAERNRLAETLDADVKRWSSGKEGNLRALLSTLQYILGPDSGWQPIPLTEVITSAAVKKAYRKATLCVHPDKLQQRGASIQQKYICEKVFDLLKEAWNKFNSEER